MTRLPLAVGLALVVVAAAVVYVTVAPRSADTVVYINVTNPTANITLPALPRDAIVIRFAPNVTGYWCIYLDIPGGVFVEIDSGITYVDTVSISCYTANQVVPLYFNGSAAQWGYYYRVVKPPSRVVVRFLPVTPD